MQKSKEIECFSENAFKEFFNENWRRGLSYIYYKYGSEGKVFRQKIIHENEIGIKKEVEIIVKAFSPEELLEDAFLKLHKHSKKYNSTEKFDFNRFKPIIDNHVKDLYRKYGEKKEKIVEENEEDKKTLPTSLLEESIDLLQTSDIIKEKFALDFLKDKEAFFIFWKNILGLALGKLKQEHRQILILRDSLYAGLDNKFVVERLANKGSISNWYNRARKSIIKEILLSMSSVEKEFIFAFLGHSENSNWNDQDKMECWENVKKTTSVDNKPEILINDELEKLFEITNFEKNKTSINNFLEDNNSLLFPVLVLIFEKEKNNEIVIELIKLLLENKPVKFLKHKKLLNLVGNMLYAKFNSHIIASIAEDNKFR